MRKGHTHSEQTKVKISQSHKGIVPNQETRLKMSLAKKGKVAWSKGKKMSIESVYKNMMNHLKYDVTLEWLQQFTDLEKLKFLNKSISRKRDSKGFDTITYKNFIEKFYHDRQFNDLFIKWKHTGDRWIKPSLDHMNPKSKGGKLVDINNLQFISWLENRAKETMSIDEWNEIKNNIHYYLSVKC